MEARPRQVLIYTDENGHRPFEAWLNTLKDAKARGLIKARIARLEAGNLGDCSPVGEGVTELRIHHGPGYRVYFGEWRHRLVLLISGGTKRTQRRDIDEATNLWKKARETL